MRDYLEELVELFFAEEDGLSDAPLEDYSVWDGAPGMGRKLSSAEEMSASQEDAEPVQRDEETIEAVPVLNEQEQWNGLRKGNAELEQTDDSAVRRESEMVQDAESEKVVLEQELEQTAQGLRRSLARAERASRYRTVSRQEDRTSSFQPTALQKDGVTGSAGVEARQVDRVFERDARRYDNRFTLF